MQEIDFLRPHPFDERGGVVSLRGTRHAQRRAEAVAVYLEDKGIPASQLIPQGFGKTHFVATNGTAEGRAENRRVELLPEQ